MEVFIDPAGHCNLLLHMQQKVARRFVPADRNQPEPPGGQAGFDTA